jgi:Flp pilus assembly protein TadD
MEEYENAKSPVREALRLKPDYVDAIHLLGLTHVRLKQYPEATALFQQAIRLTPNDAVLHLNLGKTYFLTGRKEEAQQEYRTLLRLDKEVAQKLLEMINGTSAEKK